jgi:hypothetical protein
MVLRIDTNTDEVMSLEENAPPSEPTVTGIVKERMALLKIAKEGDVVQGVGVRLRDGIYIVHER